MTDPTAVMGRRIVAFILDALVAAVIVGALIVPAFFSSAEKATWPTASAAAAHCNEVNSNTLDRIDNGSNNGQSVQFQAGDHFCVNAGDKTYELSPTKTTELYRNSYLLYAAIIFLNLCLLQGLSGASVGKLLLGLRVVKADGTKAGIGWNILRTLLLVVDEFCCFIVGLATSSRSAGHKRVGDMAASTFVVNKSALGSPLVIPGLTGNATGSWQQPPYGGQGYGNQAPYGGQPGAPASPAWGPPADATQQFGAQPTPGADGPTWDAARNAYIQYDREVGAWVQWNDDAKAWRPIDQ